MVEIDRIELNITLGQATNIVLNAHPEWAKAMCGDEKPSNIKEITKAIMNCASLMVLQRHSMKAKVKSSWKDEHGIEVRGL